MTGIKPELQSLMERELFSANAVHPAFHSLHEGYAVLLEEVCEAEEALATIQVYMERLWAAVRSDNPSVSAEFAGRIREEAVSLAAEAIQVAAMGKKLAAAAGHGEENNV